MISDMNKGLFLKRLLFFYEKVFLSKSEKKRGIMSKTEFSAKRLKNVPKFCGKLRKNC